MVANTDLNNSDLCRIHIEHEDEWAQVVLSLDGSYVGGKIVETTPDYSGGIEGKDEFAAPYTLTNWLVGITSGALYSFRALKLPRRRVFLSQLSGSMRASSMQALANGSSVGVAKLSGREPPSLDFDEWRIDCEILSPSNLTHLDSNERPSADVDSPPPPVANGEDLRQLLVALVFEALVDGDVSDPDVLFFNSVIQGDIENLKASLAAGANPDARDGEVIRRHVASLIKPPVSEKLAAAVIRMLTPKIPA